MKFLSFDIRALSLMRICVASVVMLDLAIRMSDLEMFYSNTGVVPLAMLFENNWNDHFFSFHVISGLWQVQLILFLAAFFFAVLLFMGYRTKLVTFLSWLMLLSLHNRNGYILQGGDDLLRMVLFWGIFIPWGHRYSCDALLYPELKQNKTICTVATIAYLLQICYIYTGSALLKGTEWNTDYTAMYYVYGLDQIAHPVTKYFFYYPELLKKITFLAYYFELLVPVLFFIPLKHQAFRTIGVLGIIAFHLINGVTLFIGLFPLIGIATCIGLLPCNTMDIFDKITSSFKTRISASFLAITGFVKHALKWKKPVYTLPPLLNKLKTACLIFLVVFVFDWNFSNLSFINSKLSDDLRFIGYGLRLDQNWGMFAPGVFKDDGWYVMEGITQTDKHIDLLNSGGKIKLKKPENIVSMFKNDRWRKYTETLIINYNSYMRGYFCNYSKRIWNEKHKNDEIKLLSIIYMSEFTLPDYSYSAPKKELLCECEGS